MTAHLHRGWTAIEEAPAGTMIVTDGIGWAAVAFMADGQWWLGKPEDDFREELDFEPTHWMPQNHPTNPFKAEFPDGRPTIATRANPHPDCCQGLASGGVA